MRKGAFYDDKRWPKLHYNDWFVGHFDNEIELFSRERGKNSIYWNCFPKNSSFKKWLKLLCIFCQKWVLSKRFKKFLTKSLQFKKKSRQNIRFFFQLEENNYKNYFMDYKCLICPTVCFQMSVAFFEIIVRWNICLKIISKTWLTFGNTPYDI